MNILVGIAMQFHELGGAVRHLMIRGKLLVIRLFISGRYAPGAQHHFTRFISAVHLQITDYECIQ